jgi:hypothetical protein
MSKTVPSRVFRVATLALALAASTAGVAVPQDKRERDELLARMERLLERERGPGTLSKSDAQRLAADLTALGAVLEDYKSRLAGKSSKEQADLKLNGTRVNMVLLRAKEWSRDREYPLMDDKENQKYSRWLTDTGIKGERVLMSSSAAAPWRWRIRIGDKATRDDANMRTWLKTEAAKYKERDWQQEYKGADWSAAKALGHLSDWHVHHRIPLYVGKINGGVDDGKNYLLLKDSEHKWVHLENTDEVVHENVHDRWGPWVLYIR